MLLCVTYFHMFFASKDLLLFYDIQRSFLDLRIPLHERQLSDNDYYIIIFDTCGMYNVIFRRPGLYLGIPEFYLTMLQQMIVTAHSVNVNIFYRRVQHN